jgi:hypothetical protein
MLRKDPTGCLETETHLLRRSGYYFAARVRGRLVRRAGTWSERDYRALETAQRSEPIPVLQMDDRTWWWFQGEFWRENEGLDGSDVRALILERRAKQQKRIERAKTLYSTQGGPPPPRPDEPLPSGREPITDDVKMFVWKRDGGRCVSCGSRERLEFDHIIPIAMGGSNTARNLQLLCETCNRQKGATLA